MTKEVLIRAQKGDESAINKVLKYYNGSVHHQARRQVEPGSTYFDDYMQVGRMALLEALHSVDLSRKDGFYNFSAAVMRSHMLKFSDETKLVPWHHYTHVHQYLKLKSKLEKEHNREFDVEEVLSKMDKEPWIKQQIRDALRVEKVRFSWDPVAVRILEGEINAEAELETLADSRRIFMKHLLQILTPHQRDLVEKFYYENLNADEIAEELGLARGSVWTALRLARGRLKKYWQLGAFFFALDSDHHLDINYTFHAEIWRRVKGLKYEVSNYGRVKKVEHWHRHDFIVKPLIDRQNFGYRLYTDERIGNRYGTVRFSAHNLLTSHFEDSELPFFYLREL